MTKIAIDALFHARYFIAQATDDMMRSTSYEPDNNEELYEFMTEMCSNILTKDFIDGKYTPMEYNAIRNELGKLLWKLFEKHIQKEHGTDE